MEELYGDSSGIKNNTHIDRELYVPDEELKFDNQGKLLLYRCRKEALKQQYFHYAPNSFITILGSFMLYKTFISYSSLFWVILPMPLIAI